MLAGILAAVMVGSWLGEKFAGEPITLPTFLWCMLVGVAIRNLLPLVGPTTDDRAADLISGVSLSLFLVMTMMALDLLDIARSAGPFILIVLVQAVVIVLYAIFVCFRMMGKDYEAATTSAAFIGFCMGSTATAMANMQAIVNKYGPAPKSFLIVPLAGAFFVDLMNAIVLTLLLLSHQYPSSVEVRRALLARAAELLPPPSGVTIEQILADRSRLWTWYDALDLPPAKSWWRNWRDAFPRPWP